MRVRTPKARQANHTGVHTPSGKYGGVCHSKRLTTVEEEMRQEKISRVWYYTGAIYNLTTDLISLVALILPIFNQQSIILEDT